MEMKAQTTLYISKKTAPRFRVKRRCFIDVFYKDTFF